MVCWVIDQRVAYISEIPSKELRNEARVGLGLVTVLGFSMRLGIS